MTDDQLMDDFIESIYHTGKIQDWRNMPELDDKPGEEDEGPDTEDNQDEMREAGGAGSGNYGHAGRPGEVGGSGPGGQEARRPGTVDPNRPVFRKTRDNLRRLWTMHQQGVPVEEIQRRLNIGPRGGRAPIERTRNLIREIRQGRYQLGIQLTEPTRTVTPTTTPTPPPVSAPRESPGPEIVFKENVDFAVPDKKGELTNFTESDFGNFNKNTYDRVLKGVDPKQLAEDMIRSAGGNWSASVRTGSFGSARVYLEFKQAATGTKISRVFSRDVNGNLNVYHDFFSTNKQGSGIAKEVLKSSFAQYEKLGVKDIGVNANIDVGGYAWARFGFVPKSTGEYTELAQKLRNRGGDDSLVKELDEAGRRYPELPNDKYLMWKLADSPKGKEVLLGRNWNGVFHMNDKNQVNRLNAYLKGR